MSIAFPKPMRADRKLLELKQKRAKTIDENAEKAKVRRRDKACRIPLCGCRGTNRVLEVSHHKHKGMGSKDGVSVSELMVLLCPWRHREGRVSIHARTLRPVFLTPDCYDGPIAWEVRSDVLEKMRLSHDVEWTTVAREISPGIVEPLTWTQRTVLQALSDMRF